MNAEDVKLETYKHKHLVSMFMNKIIEVLGQRSLDHDNSKLGEYESEEYAKFIPRLRTAKYGSDEHGEIMKDMSELMKHHYSNNSHHPEHFENGILDISLVDMIEMLIDWVAASVKSDTSFEEGIEINQKRFGFGDEIKQILINTKSDLDI